MEGQKDGHTLFNRTLPATAGGPKKLVWGTIVTPLAQIWATIFFFFQKSGFVSP